MKPLVDSLLAELDRHLEKGVGLELETIYFGGGTPTLLGKGLLQRLLSGLHERLDLRCLQEWCVEANPMTFDTEKARLLKSSGVTRISLGVQSWQPHFLEILGRDHSPEEASQSYGVLVEAGLETVNVDLMFSLPGQTLDDWRRDLETTLALEPKHVSAYNLTYEEDTAFFDRLGTQGFGDDEERNADLFYEADRYLSEAGFRHYEISNYARPGHESRHNRAYWEGKDYLGLGPSAVSTVNGRRWKNVADTNAYVSLLRGGKTLIEESESLGPAETHNERVALLLRTSEGLPASILDLSLRPRAEALMQEGVLELSGGRYRLRPSSRALVDPVAAELML